jgi:hypothetical protein
MLLQHAASLSLDVIVHNNPPYKQLLVGVVPGTMSFDVVVSSCMSHPPHHRRSPAIHPTSRCSSVWGRCHVISRWHAALVHPQCHCRLLAPTMSSGLSAWGWVQHCHLSLSGGPVPTIHPAGLRAVACRAGSGWGVVRRHQLGIAASSSWVVSGG